MIVLKNLTKTFAVKNGQKKYVANSCNITFPTNTSIALLGRNGAGKSTMLKMIAGLVDPDYGEVLSDGTISWPIGFAGSFHPDLTGLQNTRFVARVYGVDTDELVAYVREFTELKASFDMPFRTYSSGMRARLAFGVSMGVPFDTYLIDEITSVGDLNFRLRCAEILGQRLEQASAIVVSHSMGMVRQICNAGVVLESGQAVYYEDLEEAIAVHEANMEAA